jgi:hypothetical protein
VFSRDDIEAFTFFYRIGFPMPVAHGHGTPSAENVDTYLLVTQALAVAAVVGISGGYQ